MHAVLSSTDTDGDVFPRIGLADAPCRRGHRVTLEAADRYQKTAPQLDIEFAAMFTEPEITELLSNPMMWRPIFGGRVAVDYADCL
jgi:hypothetical protein